MGQGNGETMPAERCAQELRKMLYDHAERFDEKELEAVKESILLLERMADDLK